MLKHTTAACLLAVSLLPGAYAQEPELVTDKDKASYLIGRSIGTTIRGDEIDLNVESLVTGLREALAGKEGQIGEEEAQKIMMAFQQKMEAEMSAKADAAAKENAAVGAKFLAENKTREGVTTTESGLQYEVLEKGAGEKPTELDTVTVHYHGTLLDGTVFDSSRERNQPATFPVTGVIGGWTEALQLMPTGSKWKLYIPASLAYGEQGAGRDIGPNETLVFEVELLSIQGENTEGPGNE